MTNTLIINTILVWKVWNFNKEGMAAREISSTHAFNRFESHAESYKCHFRLDFKVMLTFLFLCYDKNKPSSSIKLKCMNLAKKIHIQPYSWILQVGSDMIKMFHLSNQKDKLYQMTWNVIAVTSRHKKHYS